jgi:hypothetical protein
VPPGDRKVAPGAVKNPQAFTNVMPKIATKVP